MKRSFFLCLGGVFGLSALSAGCADIQLAEGMYGCETDDDCPSGWVCLPLPSDPSQSRCYSKLRDGATDSAIDAHTDGGPDTDAKYDGTVPCTPYNCPSGCCNSQGRCVSGQSDQACGRNGASCTDCTAQEQICINGQCVDRQCESGLCCENHRYASNTTICVTLDEIRHRCFPPVDCGSEQQYRQRVRYCSGDSADCGNGALGWSDWQSSGSCPGACDWNAETATCINISVDDSANCVDEDCDGQDYVDPSPEDPVETTMDISPANPQPDDAIQISVCSDYGWANIELEIIHPDGSSTTDATYIGMGTCALAYEWGYQYFPMQSGPHRFLFWWGHPPAVHDGHPVICKEIYVGTP
jgi:hypothetical protein